MVALAIIGLFPQDRWGLLLALSAWVGFCTYKMGAPKRPYFWIICAIVFVIVVVDGGTNSVDAFDTAVIRALETGLGVLVYGLVTVFLWPNSSRADFEAAVLKLASTQHQVFQSYFAIMKSQGAAEDADPLKAQSFQLQARCDELLASAETDSYAVWEVRRQWRRYRRLATDLTETMERWREGFPELQELDLDRLLPNLKGFGEEIALRFAQFERMLAGQAPEQSPTAIDLALAETEVRSLSHLHKAALTLMRSRLRHLEEVTRSQFEAIDEIKGSGRVTAPPRKAGPAPVWFVIDPDRMAAVAQVLASIWLAYLAWIYVEDLPGGTMLIIISCSFGINLASMPQVPVKVLFVPVTVSVLFGALLYIFVLPGLSSYVTLGPLIFASTFAICYLFAAPHQKLGRLMGLSMFILVTAISNEQTYDFLTVANLALAFALLFLILAFTSYIPASRRPELVFLRMTARYFRSCDYLLSTMQWDPERPVTGLRRWRRAFHARELATLPRKMEAWSRFIPTGRLPGTSPEDVQSLVTNLQGLTYRVQDMLEARRGPHAPFLVQELTQDIRDWRQAMRRALRRLSEDPGGEHQEFFRARLDEIIGHMEDLVEKTLNKAGDDQISPQEGDNFYRLLGAFRGVSESLVTSAGCAAAIDWTPWRETRLLR